MYSPNNKPLWERIKLEFEINGPHIDFVLDILAPFLSGAFGAAVTLILIYAIKQL